MINKSNSNKLLILALGVTIGFSSCKKEPKAGPITPPVVPPTTTATRAELTRDSIFLYAKETYYWNDGLPTYEVFKPRSYANDQAVLDAIIKAPGTGKPTDKYSFLDDGSVSSELGGTSGDYGLSVFYNGSGSSDLRLKYVSPSSPAAAKGLKRGYRITKLNGRTDLNSSSSATITFISDAIFGSANSVSMTVQKPDGTFEDVTVTRASYPTTPIFHTSIITVGAKKVGYIVFNSFTTNSRTALTTKFAEFATAGVSELVVDLRYNGGGSVATAEAFTNLIAPASTNGTTMYTTYWTKTMQDGKAPILSHQPLLDANGKLQPFTGGVNGSYATYADIDYRPTVDAGNVAKFAKIGTANFTKVYFLVLSGTASASELLINNLRSVMDVKLIGRNTYGKPVGFFAIGIDKLDLYVPQFETKNSLNIGGYYNGLVPDFGINDDVTKDFGDVTEGLLAAALSYSQKGTFSFANPNTGISSTKAMSVYEAEKLTEDIEKHKFKGMIEHRYKLRKK